MNKAIRDLLPVMIAALAALLLVLGYAVFHKSFKLSASEALQSISSGNHSLSVHALDTFPSESTILVYLGKEEKGLISQIVNRSNISAADLLSAGNCKIFASAQPKILYSSDITQAAQALTLLTQMGYTNLYLLDTATALSPQIKSQAGDAWPLNEQMKYRFYPDSTGEN